MITRRHSYGKRYVDDRIDVSSCFFEATMNKVSRILDAANWQQHP